MPSSSPVGLPYVSAVEGSPTSSTSAIHSLAVAEPMDASGGAGPGGVAFSNVATRLALPMAMAALPPDGCTPSLSTLWPPIAVGKLGTAPLAVSELMHVYAPVSHHTHVSELLSTPVCPQSSFEPTVGIGVSTAHPVQPPLALQACSHSGASTTPSACAAPAGTAAAANASATELGAQGPSAKAEAAGSSGSKMASTGRSHWPSEEPASMYTQVCPPYPHGPSDPR